MMSERRIRGLYDEARYLSENGTGTLAERAAIEANLLKRILDEPSGEPEWLAEAVNQGQGVYSP